MISPDQVHKDIAYAYYTNAKKRLHPEFLTQLILTFQRHHTPTETGYPYFLFVKTCAEALLQFSDRIHPACLEPLDTPLVLFTAHSLSEFLLIPPTDPKQKCSFQPAADQAYEALIEPFKRRQSDLQQAGIFDWQNTIPAQSRPFDWEEPDDRSGRQEWRNAKEHERFKKEMADLAEVWQQHFYVTPFRHSGPEFIPRQAITLPFNIPYSGKESDPKFSGTWIIGTHNSGKTNLLRNLVLEDLKTDACVVLMDSKGDLLRSFTHYRPILERAVLIRPHEDHPLALNPLRATTDTVGLLEYIFGALTGTDTQLSGNMTVIFRNVLDLLEHVPDSTIFDFHHVLQFGWAKYKDAIPKVRDPDFFLQKRFDAPNYAPTKQAVAARIDRVLTNDVMRGILRSPTTKIDVARLMDQGKVILIDNREGLIGAEGCEFLGRLFIALVRDAARQRTMQSKEHRPCHLYIDECHDVIGNDPHISQIITRCRSQLISLTVAHQQITDQLQPHVLNALKNCAIKFVNAEEDRFELARSLQTTPESLRLPSGTFFTYVRHFTDGTPVLNVELEVNKQTKRLTRYPVTSDREFDAFQRQMWAQYSYTPEPRKSPSPSEAPGQDSPQHEQSRQQSPRRDRPKGRGTGVDTDPSGQW